MDPRNGDLSGSEIIRRLEVELRPLLLRWDPFGVGPECPPDEYDSYFGQVIRALRSHQTEDALVDWLAAFSTPGPDQERSAVVHRSVAGAMLEWWAGARAWMPDGVIDAG